MKVADEIKVTQAGLLVHETSQLMVEKSELTVLKQVGGESETRMFFIGRNEQID